MDVIAVVGAVTVRAVKQVTSTIPIVFTIVVDPVADEVVASMEKPGGNATGVTTFDPTQAQKQLALLREAIPGLKRVALLSDQGVRKGLTRTNVEHARALGLETETIEIAGSTPDLEVALAAVRQAHADALLLLEEPVVVQHRKQIVELATRDRIPTLISPAWVDAGALIAYGTSLTEGMRRMATYADKILRGAKPADLPVEQATTFELVINLKTAKALGLTIPQTLLLRADQVIE
jgi:putative ABC transport system substrate-binding protein